MKQRTDFVTNSSSTCYVVVAKLENRGKVDGRGSMIATGGKLLDYAKQMVKDGLDKIQFSEVLNCIDEHGYDNVALIRRSDEGMGIELTEEEYGLREKSIYTFEYH